MRKWIYDKALATFVVVLGIYLLIWLTVSYVGVYVTYVAGPLLIISGLTAYLAKPKD